MGAKQLVYTKSVNKSGSGGGDGGPEIWVYDTVAETVTEKEGYPVPVNHDSYSYVAGNSRMWNDGKGHYVYIRSLSVSHPTASGSGYFFVYSDDDGDSWQLSAIINDYFGEMSFGDGDFVAHKANQMYKYEDVTDTVDGGLFLDISGQYGSRHVYTNSRDGWFYITNDYSVGGDPTRYRWFGHRFNTTGYDYWTALNGMTVPSAQFSLSDPSHFYGGGKLILLSQTASSVSSPPTSLPDYIHTMFYMDSHTAIPDETVADYDEYRPCVINISPDMVVLGENSLQYVVDTATYSSEYGWYAAGRANYNALYLKSYIVYLHSDDGITWDTIGYETPGAGAGPSGQFYQCLWDGTHVWFAGRNAANDDYLVSYDPATDTYDQVASPTGGGTGGIKYLSGWPQPELYNRMPPSEVVFSVAAEGDLGASAQRIRGSASVNVSMRNVGHVGNPRVTGLFGGIADVQEHKGRYPKRPGAAIAQRQFLKGVVYAGPDSGDPDVSQQCTLPFECTAGIRVIPPESLPVNGTPMPKFLNRVSEIYNNPELTKGMPNHDWRPFNTIVEPWARVRVLINGVDMTYFRDIPCTIEGWEINEPFGDANASIYFPQISTYENPETHLPKWAPVTIQAMYPNGDHRDLFDGMLVDYHDGETGTGISVIGSFYESDLLLRRPTFGDDPVDVSNHICTTINGFIMLYSLNLAVMQPPLTGIIRRARGYFEKTATGYIQNLIGETIQEDGNSWTIECYQRQPVLRQKDVTTIHWTVMHGGRGIKASLKQDLIADPNVIFGEGISKDNLFWRNSKFPGVFTGQPPIWHVELGLGSTHPDVAKWQNQMWKLGYFPPLTDTFDQDSANTATQFQMDNGLIITGTVTAQTWASAFQTGFNNGDNTAAYIQALSYDGRVEAALFNGDGSIRALNPDYDPSIPRIEKYINYGPGVSKALGMQSAQREITRDYYNKGWSGTITLDSDPQEGSRFEIRAGQNINLRQFRGQDWRLHIAKVSVDMQNLSVVLTVDSRDRDLPTLAAIEVRDAEALQDPGAKYKTYRRKSYNVEDQWPMWDSEAGSGIMPIYAVEGGVWNVLRIPFGKYGEIVGSDFQCGAYTTFGMGVWDRPVYPKQLQAVGNPRDTENFWDLVDDGHLIMCWGAETPSARMAGYDPIPSSLPNDEDPVVTGRLLDTGSWTYSTQYPPWLWVTVWVADSCLFGGRFHPGTKSGEALPVLFGEVQMPDQGGGG